MARPSGAKLLNITFIVVFFLYLYGKTTPTSAGTATFTPRSTPYNAAIVLGRLQNETDRVHWLDRLENVERKVVYIVDDANSTLPHLDRNHGREAAVYLTYIINNYDNLSDITFFWHNQQVVWHNNLMMKWDSVETINRMDRDNIISRGYVPSRCDHWPGCPSWIRFNPSRAENRLDPHRLEEMFNHDLFSRIFPEVDPRELPPYFAGTCCSQFAASRDTIRQRPVATYRRLLDWILEYQHDDRSGMVLEYTWPYLFTGMGTLCPTMHECYCRTYNLCLSERRDVEALEKWNALRTRREEVKWQVNFIEDAIRAKKSVLGSKGTGFSEMVEELTRFRPEFERLHVELEGLEMNTWESREKIIHRWDLGVPPVGW